MHAVAPGEVRIQSTESNLTGSNDLALSLSQHSGHRRSAATVACSAQQCSIRFRCSTMTASTSKCFSSAPELPAPFQRYTASPIPTMDVFAAARLFSPAESAIRGATRPPSFASRRRIRPKGALLTLYRRQGLIAVGQDNSDRRWQVDVRRGGRMVSKAWPAQARRCSSHASACCTDMIIRFSRRTETTQDAMNGLDDLRGWTLGGAIQKHLDVYCNQQTFVEIKRVR